MSGYLERIMATIGGVFIGAIIVALLLLARWVIRNWSKGDKP